MLCTAVGRWARASYARIDEFSCEKHHHCQAHCFHRFAKPRSPVGTRGYPHEASLNTPARCDRSRFSSGLRAFRVHGSGFRVCKVLAVEAKTWGLSVGHLWLDKSTELSGPLSGIGNVWKTFDHPLFLITYPEHGPVYGGVWGERLVTWCLTLASLSRLAALSRQPGTTRKGLKPFA